LADTYSAESKTSREMQRTLQSVTEVMNQFRPLAEELRNRPSSLVFPSSQPPEAQPLRKQP
jgi:paraquat-inducible protein B